MKFFRYLLIFLFAAFLSNSCKKEPKDLWNIEIKEKKANLKITDLSKEYFDAKVSTEIFKQKYPWFQGTVSDEDFELRRKDTAEIKIYKEAISKIDQKKLQDDLSELFLRVRHYFPRFKTPQVFLFSSSLQMAKDPIFLQPENNFLFIDVTGFMGENNSNYQGMEQYFQTSMNPKNIVPKVSQIIAESIVPIDGDSQKFIDILVYNGKLMILQDAFLPNLPDYLKINYTPKQYEWAVVNEANIWNYFVENNLIFSDEPRLQERFIAPAPFSKFYTAIDNESSPQIGIFTGWQISKKYFEKKPDTPPQDFIKMKASEIFNQSEYKPK